MKQSLALDFGQLASLHDTLAQSFILIFVGILNLIKLLR